MGTAGCYSPNDPITGSQDETGETTASVDTEDPSTVGPSSSVGESDGSTSGGDVSSESTASESGDVEPFCGDGQVNGDEVCDDGVNEGGYGGCFPNCSGLGPHCGDGGVQGDEACDDGNETEADGCNTTCVVSGSVEWTRTFGTSYATGVAIDELDGIVVITGEASIHYFAPDGDPGAVEVFDIPGAASTSGSSSTYHPVVGWAFAGSSSIQNEGHNASWQVRAPGTDLTEIAHVGTYNNLGNTDDTSEDIAFDGAGNYFVCGYSELATLDAWVRKFSPDGEPLWAQAFDGGDDDVFRAVAVDADGNAIVGGHTINPVSGTDAWLRKYDPEGGVAWTRTSAGPENSTDRIFAVAVGPDDQIAVAGRERHDIWVRLYNPGGAVQWTGTYDGPAVGGDADCGVCFFQDQAGAVVIDSTGAVIAAGHQMIDSGVQETWIGKYSPSGEVLWTESTGPDVPSSYQHAYAVAVDSADHIVVVGNWEDQAWVQKRAP